MIDQRIVLQIVRCLDDLGRRIGIILSERHRGSRNTCGFLLGDLIHILGELPAGFFDLLQLLLGHRLVLSAGCLHLGALGLRLALCQRLGCSCFCRSLRSLRLRLGCR